MEEPQKQPESKQHQNGGNPKKIKKRKEAKKRVKDSQAETEREMVRQVIFSLTGQLSDSLLGPTDKTGQVAACKYTHTHTHTQTFNDYSLASNCRQGQHTGRPEGEY